MSGQFYTRRRPPGREKDVTLTSVERPWTIALPPALYRRLMAHKDPVPIGIRALEAELDRIESRPVSLLMDSLGIRTNREMAAVLRCSPDTLGRWILHRDAPGPVNYFAMAVFRDRGEIKARTGSADFKGGLTPDRGKTGVLAWRELLGCTPETLAGELDISLQTLARYEDPGTGPPAYVERLAAMALRHRGAVLALGLGK